MKFFNKLVIAMLFTSALCVLSHGASVAYVEDGGAKHTFENIYDAIACLGEDGGKIYITSAVSLADGEELASSGKVTLTADGGSLNFGAKTYICGDFTFENITLGFSQSASMLFCEGNNVTFGEGIKTSYSGTAPIIHGGTFGGKSGITYSKMCFSDYTITVKSGTWYYIKGGSFRDSEGQPVGTLSGVTLNIEGGTFTSQKTGADDNAVISPTGFDALLGDATLSISGGTFKGASIVGIARPGYNSTTSNNQYARGNVYINITGGNFSGGDVRAVQDSVASEIDGDFYLKISGGTFKSFTGADAKCVNGLAIADVKSGIKTSNFDPLYTLSSGQSVSVNGDALIRVSGTVPSSAIKISGDGKVVIEGVDENSKITIGNVLYVGTNTEIRNIALDGYGTGIISCSDGKILIGEGITGNGIALKNFTDATLRSGLFAYVKGAREKSVKLHIDGATVSGDVVAVANECKENGYVLFTSGTVNGNIYAFEYSGGEGAVHVYEESFKGKVGAVKHAREACVDTFGAVAPFSAKISYVGAAKYVMPSGAVFVSDGGEGDGSSPLSPLGSIVEAAEAANGKTVVLCGPISLKSTVTLPKVSGKTVITSKYMGLDFADFTGACIELSSGLRTGGETVFENIDFLAFEKYTFLSAEGNPLVIGEGVECRIFEGKRVEKYPSLVGASHALTTKISSVDLTVQSGTWGILSGGSYHTSDSDTKNYTVSGGIKVDIFGGRFEDGVYLTGRANVSDGAVLNIFGGEFACPIYAAHDTDTRVGGDVKINVSGGSFCGDIGRRGVGKSFTLNLADGDFARVCAVDLGGGVLNLGEGIDLDAKISGIGRYQNPVAGYADPSVVYHDGWYYYSYAKDYLGEPGLWMAKAPNIFDIGNVEPTLIWSRAVSGTGDEIASIWAPQLYNFDGKWYLYATCDVGIESTLSNGRRMPTVWQAKTDNPIGEYEYFGVIKNVDMDVVSYNSPRFVEHGGRRYMVNGSFFREEDCTNQHIQRTFITELSDPLTACSKAVLISSPVYDFEKNIMEGPFPIYSPSGTLYMIFAAGHTRTDEYCTGILRFNGSESDSLADASKWEKFSAPLQFASYENGVYSPGAMVVTKTPSGDGYLAAYHAKQYHYSAYTMRRLYVQKLWFENDFPVIDEPQAVDTVFEIALNSLPLAKRIFGYSDIGVASSDAAEPPKGSVVYVDYFLFGDVNFDDKTDLLDVLKLLKILVGERCEDYVRLRADTDSDGEVTARDVLKLLSTIL